MATKCMRNRDFLRVVSAGIVYSARYSRCETIDPYKVLGVSRGSSDEEIRKAYKRKAAAAHPDRGGDAEEFKRIASAYATLSDKSKKEVYDRYGKYGQQMGSGGAARGESDLFEAFRLFEDFLGGGGTGRSFFMDGESRYGNQRRKPAARLIPFVVTLEQLFKGGDFKVAVPRDINCDECQGAGGTRLTCNRCHGRGFIFEDRRYGDFLQRIQRPCQECQGNGSKITKRCQKCQGEGRLQDNTHTISLHLPPGSQAGEQFIFPNQGDSIGTQAQDIVLYIQEAEHPELQRLGADLLLAKRISLLDALTGFCLDLPDISSTHRLIAFPEAHSLPATDGDVLKISGLGMPDKSGRRGALYVRLIVDTPKRMPPMSPSARRALLAKALGGDPELPVRPPTPPSSIFDSLFKHGSSNQENTKNTTASSTSKQQPRQDYIAKRASDRDVDRLFQQRRHHLRAGTSNSSHSGGPSWGGLF